jgi:hypothetical protein
MGPVATRWLAPVGASAAVLVAVVVPAVVAAPGPRAGGAPSPDRTVDRRLPPDRLVLPAPRPGDRRDSRIPRGVVITGYQGGGRVLTVFYRVGPRSDCSTDLRRPRVIEMPTSVSVRLERAPTRRPEELCAEDWTGSVDIRLDDPLAGKVVQDMARRGGLVPIQRPFRSAG